MRVHNQKHIIANVLKPCVKSFNSQLYITMLEIYAVIGSALVVSGIVYVYIFIRYLLQDIRSSEVIIAVSEALVTLAIGAFYIYSVFVLGNYPKNPVTNFTNTIDDILVRNETFEYFFTTAKPEEVSIYEENNEEVDFIEAMEENGSNDQYTVSTEETVYAEEVASTKVAITTPKITPEPEVNKTEQFIKNYQNFLREIIKQKLSNSSIFNQTLTNMKYGPANIKTSRSIKIEPEEDNCFYDFFIENALLMYSFIHCLLTLIKNTVQCRTCIKTGIIKESKDNEPYNSKQEGNSDALDTSGSEKNDVSAPVGPIFGDSVNSGSFNIRPNLKLFQVKGTQSKTSTEVLQKNPGNSQKYKLSFQLTSMWLLPVLSLIVLYFSTKTELDVFDYEQNIIAKANFTVSPANQNFMEQVQTPINVTSEVERVVSKIYNIVNEVKENVGKKTTHFTPMMAKVIYFTSQKPRIQKNPASCSQISTFLKVYYFLIFIIGYFVVILFAKITETSAKDKDSVKAKQQNICLLTFSMLWLPSVLDLFCRTFISQQGNSTVVSDIFLALGNSNRIQTMFADHIFIKKHTKPNFVNPI